MERRLNSYLPCKQYPWLEDIKNTILFKGKDPDISLQRVFLTDKSTVIMESAANWVKICS